MYKKPTAKQCINNQQKNFLQLIWIVQIHLICSSSIQKVFHCALDHGLAEDPGNEPMIKKACMKESCYSGKKSDHQINHDPQTFVSFILDFCFKKSFWEFLHVF